jgi:hypothetical protein
MGQCDRKTRTITVDVVRHLCDAEIRSTLLHEMAHAASRTSKGHDLKFFAQLEKLLRKGARISIANPEAGRVISLADVVPRRFPLLRRKMQVAESHRVSQMLAVMRNTNAAVIEVTGADIVRQFEDAALEVTWKGGLAAIGLENGLVDETGRPVNRWAAQIIRRSRKAYMRSRRVYLNAKRIQNQWDYLLDPKAQEGTPSDRQASNSSLCFPGVRFHQVTEGR